MKLLIGQPYGNACAICGCTQDQACPGGCFWVQTPDRTPLCSNEDCQDAYLEKRAEQLVKDAKRRRR